MSSSGGGTVIFQAKRSDGNKEVTLTSDELNEIISVLPSDELKAKLQALLD